MRNDTRWSSKFEMLSRYFELKGFFDHTDTDLAVHILSASEERELHKKIFDELKYFDLVSRVLQAKDSNKLQSRVLFDEFCINYPEFEHYLGRTASGIMHSPVFERAMYKYLKKNPLSCGEKLILSKCFGEVQLKKC